jgi:ribosomal subunit interface protein
MKLIVKARHMNLTPALKSHAEQKLGEAIRRIFDRPATTLEIELTELGRTKDGLDKECRVTAFMPKGKTINIVEVADDMYKAIDLVRDRLLTQVKRQRTKKRDTARGRKEAGKSRAATARKSLTDRV